MSLKEEDDISIADALRDSIEEDTSPEPLSEKASQRERDESGRFKGNANNESAKEVTPPEAPPVEPTPTPPVDDGKPHLTTEKPPSSWTAEAKAAWNELPEHVKSDVIRREQDGLNRARQIQEKYEPLEYAAQSLSPIFQEAQQYGVDAVAYIQDTMQIERALRTAEMPQKFDALMSIADKYGVPLRQIINQSVGQEVLKQPAQQQQMQIPPEFAREIHQLKEWREQQEFNNVVSNVENWGSSKPHFNEVRVKMGELVERGLVHSIDEAYDQACWLIPEVRAKLMQPQESNINTRQRQAAGVSKQGSGKVDVNLKKTEDEMSIADIVREATLGSR